MNRKRLFLLISVMLLIFSLGSLIEKDFIFPLSKEESLITRIEKKYTDFDIRTKNVMSKDTSFKILVYKSIENPSNFHVVELRKATLWNRYKLEDVSMSEVNEFKSTITTGQLAFAYDVSFDSDEFDLKIYKEDKKSSLQSYVWVVLAVVYMYLSITGLRTKPKQ